MSKLTPSLAGFACFLWVSGWTWIFSEGRQSSHNSSNPVPINILLDSVRYKVQHPFAFEYSEATPIVAEQLHPALKSVVSKLSKSPSTTLTVTGVYAVNEKNETRFANLGVARAEAIKAMLETAGAAADQISTESMEVANLFQMDGNLTGVIYFSYHNGDASKQATATGKKKSSDEPKAEEVEHMEEVKAFSYKYGDYKVEKRHLEFLNDLRRTLRDDPDQKVLLTGYSAPEEEAESSRVNLAEMRALAIRRYLIDHGIRRAQIEVKAKPSMARGSQEMIVSIQVFED